MILIVAEHKEGKLRKSALELVTAASELAPALGGDVVGLVIGADPSAAAQELAGHVGTVLTVSGPEFEHVRAEVWTTAVTNVARDRGARAVLVPGSRAGLSYGPRVAMRLDAPLLEDVTRLEADGDAVTAKRLTYLSRVTETVRASGSPVVVSVKPNVFAASQGGASGNVEAADVVLEGTDTRVRVGERKKAATGRVALDEAAAVVSGGRGLGSPEGFNALVEPLADVLGAGIGSTRAVVDAGWRPYAEQVGQTGKTVAPNLYIALGISGAVQHLSGMNRSKVVVAINKDADAPIFKVSDYGIVGDVQKIVPALTEAIKAHKE